MNDFHLLRGSCSCGRNRYVVEVPSNVPSSASVFFDRGFNHRLAHTSPLSAYLRVPLSWYHSSTHALFPDETFATIKRVYTPRHELAARRQFCGYCGTPLTYWSEQPRSEADWISLALGSLEESDLEELDALGLVPGSSDDEEEEAEESSRGIQPAHHRTEPADNITAIPTSTPRRLRHAHGGEVTHLGSTDFGRGVLPWFEEMVEGSRLGRVRRKSVHRESGETDDGGRYKVEWEIVEYDDDDDDDEEDDASGSLNAGKRKMSEVQREDANMEETV